mmetsp:Transcript_23208/g.43625  ORF Transcript_23208/g.43625 Transcript_23208/m.43625 type:complete len:216 (-) Transcript_23208:62-709(-)
MMTATDAVFGLASFATPVAVTYAMLAGGKTLTETFTWHPILMSLAFPCLMVLGRWAYVSESVGEKPQQRSVHRSFMMLSATAGVAGYVMIFLSHVKTPSFFGYNFATHTWAVPSRIVHDFLGYSVLLLMLAQAVMGLMKLAKLQTGERSFTFHGQLGKAIIVLGASNIVVACVFWSWTPTTKIVIGGLALAAALCGVLWPIPVKPEAAPLTESKP